MGQHLYPCEQCGGYGVAHYVLAEDAQGWFNVTLCTGCFTEYRKGAALCSADH